jgi:hypothetical protein
VLHCHLIKDPYCLTEVASNVRAPESVLVLLSVRMQQGNVGMNNRTLGPYLAAIDRILFQRRTPHAFCIHVSRGLACGKSVVNSLAPDLPDTGSIRSHVVAVFVHDAHVHQAEWPALTMQLLYPCQGTCLLSHSE